jgi:GNAT superfamily N-acetyltransferase
MVRAATRADAHRAEDAAALIAAAAASHDVALRAPALLRAKIEDDHAVVALEGEELVGFGFWSEWEEGRFVSHSGLVVRADRRGRGLGRRLKLALLESSRRGFPRASLMSLSNSPEIKALNLALGFRVVPLERLTRDPGFWDGCRACRNWAEVVARGERCCCEGMLLAPEEAP